MAIDWTKTYKKYKGLWVALKDDEQTVVASGQTAKEAWDRAREKGYAKPILAHMPDKLVTYVGLCNLNTKNTDGANNSRRMELRYSGRFSA